MVTCSSYVPGWGDRVTLTVTHACDVKNITLPGLSRQEQRFLYLPFFFLRRAVSRNNGRANGYTQRVNVRLAIKINTYIVCPESNDRKIVIIIQLHCWCHVDAQFW
jgi:hypothetical protein